MMASAIEGEDEIAEEGVQETVRYAIAKSVYLTFGDTLRIYTFITVSTKP